VVRAAPDFRATLQSSEADECAATLPHASEAGGGGEQRTSSATSTQGLRPSIATSTLSSSSTKHFGQDDEEADIQAALRASMAGADLSGDTGINSTSSRMQSPTVAGQRRFRGGNSGEEDSFEDEEETDAHVDAIAPSRRRARGLGPGEGSSLVTARGMGVPYILPTASGGRRRASRLQNDEEEPRMISSSRAAQRAMRRPSGSNQHPIAIDDDDDDDDLLGNADSDDVDDFEEVNMAASAPRSPFLNPALNAALVGGSGNNTDEDFHSISSGEGILEESWSAADAAVLQRQALISDRHYDDEDAQLQAALAASIRDAEGSSSGISSVPPTADWISEEDSRAIQEAQLASWTSATIARQDSDQGPTPADVAKIARMRAEAKQKAEDERLGITRENANGQSTAGSSKANQSADEDDDDDEESAPQMTPEEMRKARLARFSA
jgi:ataxin-3